MNMKLAIGFCVACCGWASAHLGPLTSPKAGESFKPGDKVTLAWTVDTKHDGIDLAVSTDGTTWTTFKENLPLSTKTFAWTVPNTPSANARIRICQRDGGGGCTDAQNASSPQKAIALAGGGAVYTLISGKFSITSPSGVIDASPRDAAALHPVREFSSVEIAFSLDRSEHVSLFAYDMQGRLVTTLMDETKAKGAYKYSIFSRALDGSRPLILKFKGGDQAVTQAWPSLLR